MFLLILSCYGKMWTCYWKLFCLSFHPHPLPKNPKRCAKLTQAFLGKAWHYLTPQTFWKLSKEAFPCRSKAMSSHFWKISLLVYQDQVVDDLQGKTALLLVLLTGYRTVISILSISWIKLFGYIVSINTLVKSM